MSTTKKTKQTTAKKTTPKSGPTRARVAKAAATPPDAQDAARANTAAAKAKRAAKPQDHEVPSPKEVANNARLEAHGEKVVLKHKPPKPAHVSVLDAAVLVLASAPDGGLSAKAMIEQIVAQGLWSSPAGKTPEATLYAAITREIGRKGKAARFRKVDRGRFALAEAAV